MKVLYFSLFKATSGIPVRVATPVWPGDAAEEVARNVVRRATRLLDCDVADLTHVEFLRHEHHF